MEDTKKISFFDIVNSLEDMEYPIEKARYLISRSSEVAQDVLNYDKRPHIDDAEWNEVDMVAMIAFDYIVEVEKKLRDLKALL